MVTKEFHIWLDESDKRGKYYSDFYGGMLVESRNYHEVITRLEDVLLRSNLMKELKWQKVTTQYLDKYKAVIDELFSILEDDLAKIRIMFTKNSDVPVGLTKEQLKDGYFLLYYQFVQHAFGLTYHNNLASSTYIRLHFDNMPHQKYRRETFKNHIYAIQKKPEFRRANLKIRKHDIVEVDSKDHLLLQCLDIVLGSMSFRLNNKHKIIPKGLKRRGKRTIAKEKLYKYINSKIRELYPNFNIGESTGRNNNFELFSHPYRHWRFKSKNSKIDESFFK